MAILKTSDPLVNGEPYTGTGYFKFAIITGAINGLNVWTNDDSNLGTTDAPDDAVESDVQHGLFSVNLGNVLVGMPPLSATVFDEPTRWLRVWFDEDGVGAFTDLGTTRITAVPYAMNAELFDGLDSEAFQQKVDHVVVVAKSGGDHTTINAALDSITDSGPESVYLVWVGPGVYSETVEMKPYVHIQGAGQDVTVVTSTVACSMFGVDRATLVLTRNVSLRDLTVVNHGAEYYGVALLARGGTTETLVADVTARAQGSGTVNIGIRLVRSSSEEPAQVTLLDVTALAENGTGENRGMRTSLFEAVLQGGSYTGRGGGHASGLSNGGGAGVEAKGVTALGEGGSVENAGFDNASGGGSAILRGGSFIARGGDRAYGVWNEQGATLEANNITALAEDAITCTYGLYNYPKAHTAVATVTLSILEGATAPVYNGTGDSVGSVTIYHSRLVSSNPVTGTGTTTCVAVSRGITFTAGTACP